MTLEVRADNARAIALYEHCGFRRTGLIPNAVAEDQDRYDVVLMHRELTRPAGVRLVGSEPIGVGASTAGPVPPARSAGRPAARRGRAVRTAARDRLGGTRPLRRRHDGVGTSATCRATPARHAPSGRADPAHLAGAHALSRRPLLLQTA